MTIRKRVFGTEGGDKSIKREYCLYGNIFSYFWFNLLYILPLTEGLKIRQREKERERQTDRQTDIQLERERMREKKDCERESKKLRLSERVISFR